MEHEKVIEILNSRITIAVFGVTFGLLFTFIFNDYVRPLLSSVRSILSRLQEGKPIGNREERRVSKYAKDRLQEWIAKLKSPASESEKYDIKDNFIKMAYEYGYKKTKCPSSSDFIFIDTTAFVDNDDFDVHPNDIASKIEHYLLQIESSDNISKQLFNIKGVCPEIVVWLKIPNYLVKSMESLNDLFAKCEVVTKSWFPNSTLKIELFIPNIIMSQSDRFEIPPGLTDFHFRSAQITYLKDVALSTLTKKNIVGKLNFDESRRIPSELIKTKLPTLSSFDSPQIIKVVGQPGSGKTEILNYIIQNVISEHTKLLVICFNSPEELLLLNKYFGKYDSFIDYLVGIIDLYELFDYPKEEMVIVREILRNILKRRLISILIVIDNLEYAESLFADIIEFSSSKMFTNVKFLLASRYLKTQNRFKRKTMSIETNLWTYEESVRIIEAWNGNTDAITNKNWLKANKKFSTYLLRIISTTDAGIELDELVRKEINSILAPVLNSIESTKFSADEQILKIKKLVQEDKLSVELVSQILNKKRNLDIIKVFGNITWSRIYNSSRDENENELGLRTNIIPERIINWSNNMIPDIQTANAFIRACKNSGVIKDFNLSDKLVQDGTAAITLQEDYIRNYLLLESSNEDNSIKLNEIEGVIHDLITSLSKKNSLEIFKLSFRANHLIVVINSIINSKRNKEILVELLSVDYIKYLTGNPKNIEIIAFNLIRSFDKSELAILDKVRIGQCLSRLIKEDNNLKTYFEELIANGQKGELVFCVYAQLLFDDLEVFDLATNDQEKVILFDYCCRTWSTKMGGVLLMTILLSGIIGRDRKLLHEHFMLWIERHGSENAIGICDQILDLLFKDEEVKKKMLIELLLKIFKYLFSNRKEINLKRSLSFKLDQWAVIIKKYYFSKASESSELIKMLAYGFNRELCDLKSNYMVIADKKDNTVYAIPKNQFKKEGIQAIFNNFPNTRNFDLPSSKLLSYVYVKSDGKELISDHLKSRKMAYVPFPKLFPNEHKYFENKEIRSMTVNDINSTQFGWRAVFKI